MVANMHFHAQILRRSSHSHFATNVFFLMILLPKFARSVHVRVKIVGGERCSKSLARASDFSSIRWSGTLKAPADGEFKCIIKTDGGYRLTIDDKILVEDWTDHDLAVRSNHIHLEKGRSYGYALEYFQSSRRPQLFVQWELLNTDPIKKAVDLAKSSDVVIFVGGITSRLEGEEMRVDYGGFNGGDRAQTT